MLTHCNYYKYGLILVVTDEGGNVDDSLVFSNRASCAKVKVTTYWIERYRLIGMSTWSPF